MEGADGVEHTGLGVGFVAESLGHRIVDGARGDDAIDDRLGSLAGADQSRIGLDVCLVRVGEAAPYRDPAGLLQPVDAVAQAARIGDPDRDATVLPVTEEQLIEHSGLWDRGEDARGFMLEGREDQDRLALVLVEQAAQRVELGIVNG